MTKQRLKSGPPLISVCPHCRTNFYSKYARKNHACKTSTREVTSE